MKRLIAAVTVCLFALAGCGGSSKPVQAGPIQKAQIPNAVQCPQAASGKGAAGVCGPPQLLPNAISRSIRSATVGATYPDLSNNDPCVCGASLKAQGRKGLIVKANQGVGFVDRWAVPMAQSARAAGLAVGAYDFDQDYTVAEAALFVSRLKAMGIYPNTPNTFPAYLDVEFGNFNYVGLTAQIAFLRAQGYRVGIYTGAWYWTPHAGCRWPAGVSAWISGYPFAPAVCGLPAGLYNSHQFTDTPVDLSVFLGPGTFQQFVNAGPVGESAAVKHARAARDSAFRQYRAHKCRAPQQDNVCRHIGRSIESLQAVLWGSYPRWVLFGKRASHLRSAIAWVVRPEAAYWSHARNATVRAYRADCVAPGEFPSTLNTKHCRILSQRGRWFGSHASALVKAYS